MSLRYFAAVLALGLFAAVLPAADKTPREALKDFNLLVGDWEGTGEPDGSRTEKEKFWQEVIGWEWQFKGDDAWIKMTFTNGKHFTAAELRYLPDKDRYRLVATTPARESLTFEGTYENKRLVVERLDPQTKDTHRLVVTLLHENRYLYQAEVRKAERASFTRIYRVGAKRKGVPFASSATSDPECIVSGGKGTMAVSHKGKTYYVCCSGCRDEFRANPEKYIKEYEEAQKQKKKP